MTPADPAWLDERPGDPACTVSLATLRVSLAHRAATLATEGPKAAAPGKPKQPREFIPSLIKE